MRKLVLGLLAVGALAFPAAASAGGWATAGLTPSKPPEGSGPGDRWVATITVLQHGRTPLAGLEPVLTLTNTKTGKRLDFRAKPTSEIGAYRVAVKLPSSGTWNVSVYDGFGQYGGAQTHTFAPITIGDGGAPSATPSDQGPAPAPDRTDGSVAVWPLALGTLAAALGAAVALLARRSRRKAPAVT